MWSSRHIKSFMQLYAAFRGFRFKSIILKSWLLTAVGADDKLKEIPCTLKTNSFKLIHYFNGNVTLCILLKWSRKFLKCASKTNKNKVASQ